MNLSTALDIIDADYAGDEKAGEWRRSDLLSLDGIQASTWAHVSGRSALCCTGSNDGWDWWRNFQPFPGWMGRGDSGRLYHRGMIEGARTVYAWVLRTPINYVIGHSGGGGVGQIVGSSRGSKTLTVCAPRVLVPFQTQPPGAELVENVILGCDIVSRVPVTYSHVGRVQRLTCRGWGFKHGTAAVRAAAEVATRRAEQ
jgi:hypothetical protein